jgi:hypothetical protein
MSNKAAPSHNDITIFKKSSAYRIWKLTGPPCFFVTCNTFERGHLLRHDNTDLNVKLYKKTNSIDKTNRSASESGARIKSEFAEKWNRGRPSSHKSKTSTCYGEHCEE